MFGRVFGIFTIVATLGGCADRAPRSDDVQSFLGISQDIRSVFSTGTDYKSPLGSLFGD
jgi:hypothetical protein